jgi:hypothetical protein
MGIEQYVSAKDAKGREVKIKNSRFGFSLCAFASFADNKDF